MFLCCNPQEKNFWSCALHSFWQANSTIHFCTLPQWLLYYEGKEVKASVSADDTIFYKRKSSKNTLRKLLQVTNTLSQVSEYKISTHIHKSVAFQYTNDRLIKKSGKQYLPQ